jgi:hypothetical protein
LCRKGSGFDVYGGEIVHNSLYLLKQRSTIALRPGPHVTLNQRQFLGY